MFSSLFIRRNSITSPLRYLTIRGSCSKLFVGGLSYDTNEPVLKNEFEKYGEIIEVKVICDHKSGKSKGYGFVLFDSEEAAASALASMNNQLLEGRNIRVEYAQPKSGLYQNQK
ncbi:RNA recognition motif domain eukaryote [Arabidopsis suecica]|uniref:RNA recognition motif domain eukaryote n=1 Tax=Arabidopsis suecica TaxID=45249 RepID=A0A8T1Y2W5_ARASU|nr:RNA recognition motif domain eukaryote [Arabidopsis suecica]